MTTSPQPPSSTPTPAAWQRRLPNALTMARIGLAAVFFLVLAMFDYRDSPLRQGRVDWLLVAAAGLFIVAALTDALDGHLARKWGVVSLFGRVMDPFADKLLVLGAFVMLAGPGFGDIRTWVVVTPSVSPAPTEVSERLSLSHVAPWMVVLILARELLITSLRGVFESQGVSFAATASGKWKMILQSACVPLALLLPNVPRTWGRAGNFDWADWAVRIVVWATVIVTVWSGLPYILRALRKRGEISP